VTTRKALAAIDRRPGFGINLDPSHFIPQFLDPAAYAMEFADRIYNVHVKDSQVMLDGRRSILGLAHRLRRGRPRLDVRVARARRRGLRGALPRPEPDRLRRPAVRGVGGLGDGPRLGRPDAVQFLKRTDFSPSAVVFDAAFQGSS
jgi:hypothetical protein